MADGVGALVILWKLIGPHMSSSLSPTGNYQNALVLSSSSICSSPAVPSEPPLHLCWSPSASELGWVEPPPGAIALPAEANPTVGEHREETEQAMPDNNGLASAGGEPRNRAHELTGPEEMERA